MIDLRSGQRSSADQPATEPDALTPTAPSPSHPPLFTLQRVWAAALAVLVLLSWRLWVPQPLVPAADFPRVPLLTLGQPLVVAVDWLGLIGLLAALLVILIRKPVPWQAFAGVSLALGLLFLANQHRLQPWAYQGWLYGVMFAALPPATARRLLIALTISIYTYSALGKFDQQFLHTVGPDLVAALAPWLARGAGPADGVLSLAALALPSAELGLAILLAIPRTRRLAGCAAIAMHSLLVIALGPLGLGHSNAVLAWNVFLAIQAWLLFVRPQPAEPPPLQSLGVGQRGVGVAAKIVALAALTLPLLERSGYWDHWLSWSLYSPHTSRVDVQVHRSATESLPSGAAEFLRPSEEQDGWYDVALDRWSLAQLAVPVYPQSRFQLGVAQLLAQPLPSPDAIRIKIRGVADRRSGQRSELWLIGRRQIDAQADQYWLLPQR